MVAGQRDEIIQDTRTGCVVTMDDIVFKFHTRITELTQERDAAMAEVKLWEKRDEVKAMSHELAVRERQAEILAGEGWSNGKTVEPFKSERLSKALSQSRAEIAKEAEVKPEVKP